MDYIAAYFDSLGLTDYIVEVGGEIFCRGSNAEGKPWRVGIDRPAEGNAAGADLETVIGLSGQGLATSGNYRKFIPTTKAVRSCIRSMPEPASRSSATCCR